MRLRDYIAIALLVVLALYSKLQNTGNEDTPTLRRPAPVYLPPATVPSPSLPSGGREITVNLDKKTQTSVGTAFSVARSGIWITARHVTDGCDLVALQWAEKKFNRVLRIRNHPNADISVMRTKSGVEPLPVIRTTVRRGQDGYSFGFPKGDPGDVYAKALGQRTMRINGRYRTREPVVAWTQIRRVPDRGTHLGGISGGPWTDARGRVIGVHVAGAPRRGRSYSTAPTSLIAAIEGAGVSAASSNSGSFSVNQGNFPNIGDRLRSRLTVAKVYCMVGERWRKRARRGR
jgi:S1-C subfamily serine protease